MDRESLGEVHGGSELSETLLTWHMVHRVKYSPEFIEVWSSCDEQGPLLLYIKGSEQAKNGMLRREFWRGTTHIMEPSEAMLQGFYKSVLSAEAWAKMQATQEEMRNPTPKKTRRRMRVL